MKVERYRMLHFWSFGCEVAFDRGWRIGQVKVAVGPFMWRVVR